VFRKKYIFLYRLPRFKHRRTAWVKQRLTIASAALSDAEILILDEPTSGLERANMMCLVDLLAELSDEGKLILVISHDFEFLNHCCTRLFSLK